MDTRIPYPARRHALGLAAVIALLAMLLPAAVGVAVAPATLANAGDPYTISGHVYGPDGVTPLDGVEVGAGGFNYGGGDSENTDRNGYYSLQVPADSYEVSLIDLTSTYVRGCYASGGFTIDLNACTLVSVDASNSPVTIDVSMTTLAGHIDGKVMGSDGLPVSGMGFVAFDPAAIGASNFSSDVTTKPDGTFQMDVPAGSYTVQTLPWSPASAFPYIGGCYAVGATDSSGTTTNFTSDFNACTTFSVDTSRTTSIAFTMQKAVPGAPTGVFATEGDGQAVVSWTTPADDGGSSITGYTVTGSDGTSGCTWTSGPLTCTVAGLTDGTMYTFTVTAGNGIGTGPSSDYSNDVTPIGTPAPNTISGIVTGPDGAGLGGVSLWATDDNQGTSGNGVTNLDGTFMFAVPPGAYRIDMYSGQLGYGSLGYASGCYSSGANGNLSNGSSACTSVSVDGSAVTGINVILPMLVNVGGSISVPAGSDLSNVQVIVHPIGTMASPKDWGSAGPDNQGDYTYSVIPGVYQIDFQDYGLTFEDGCYDTAAPGNFTSDPSACSPVTVGTSGVDDIDVTLPLRGQTPVTQGTPVTVAPSESGSTTIPATVTFTNVSVAGTTTLQSSTSGPVASDFSLGDNPTYYDVATDAKVTGPITVCFQYNPFDYTDGSDLDANPDVHLYHFSGGVWTDITNLPVDTDNTTICGTTDSLSPFAIGLPTQQPQSITFGSLASQTYGAGPVALTASATSGLEVGYSSTGPCAVGGPTLTITGAGTCTVTASQAGDATWGAASSVSQSFTITPAPLTVAALTLSRAYGVANPAFTPTYSGFVAGDTAASLSPQPTCATTATASSPVGTYPITCSGAVDPNYSFTYVPGALTIAIADRFVTPTNTTLNVAAPGFLALTSAPGATVVISTQPTGKLTLGSGGAFTYVPKSGFSGTDSFAYRLNTNGSLSAPVTVTIYVVGTGMNCSKCNLSGLTLSGVNLTGANLSSANLTGTRLTSTNLTGANLSSAVLAYAALTYANLTGANLSSATLSYAALDHANLTGANLSSAVLSNATLTYANMTGANLSKATLAGANLTGATLTGANLTSANLAGATFQSASVTGVSWSNAVCPDGTNSSKAGGTCVGHLGP